MRFPSEYVFTFWGLLSLGGILLTAVVLFIARAMSTKNHPEIVDDPKPLLFLDRYTEHQHHRRVWEATRRESGDG